jgi:excisionase family DNA binding protein
MPNANRSGLLDDYFSVEEFARQLGVHPQTIRRWHAERRGPPRTRIGHGFYYRRAAIETWLLKREQSPDATVPPRRGRPRSHSSSTEPGPPARC